MGTGDAAATGDAIEAANRRIQEAIERLPDVASPDLWPVLVGQGAPPPEVVVHVLRACRSRGLTASMERAADELIARAYPIAQGIVRRTLRSRPQDHDDAIRDAFATMWRYIVEGAPFWERNFVGALNAVCISACRTYLTRKRSDVPFAELAQPAEGVEFGEHVRDPAAEGEQQAVLGWLAYERALGALEPSLREIARLLTEEELTQREIAVRVGCTEKTVYNRLARIRDQLARYYHEEGINVY